MEDKDRFKARYGTREEALDMLHRQMPSSNFYTHRALTAIDNPALTDDDLFGFTKHPHSQVSRGASMALNTRGWKRKSILTPNEWIRKD
jgi:hypothetical protein